jgi:hypothetical protein
MLTACGNATATTAVTTDAPAPDPVFGKIKFLVYNGSTEVLNDRPANNAEFMEFLNIYRTENNQFSNTVYNGGIYYINEYNKYLKIATSGDYNKLKTESYDIHTNDILRILNDTREYGYAAAEYFRKETIEKLK